MNPIDVEKAEEIVEEIEKVDEEPTLSDIEAEVEELYLAE